MNGKNCCEIAIKRFLKGSQIEERNEKLFVRTVFVGNFFLDLIKLKTIEYMITFAKIKKNKGKYS